MAEYEDQVPESQLGRAEWLADELALCGHEEITAIDMLDALASVGLKLVPDNEGVSSHEYMGVPGEIFGLEQPTFGASASSAR